MLEILRQDEGYELKPYTDSVGKITIGIGHNLTDRGISHGMVLELASDDILEAYEFTRMMFPSLDQYSDPRKQALISMMFNLGPTKFKQFEQMAHAIKAGEWDTAAKNALDSRWAIQVGDRSNRIAKLLRTA
jgi:lysozyme